MTTAATAKAGAGGAADPCSLVPVPELKAAIGAPQVGAGERKDVGLARTCTYRLTGEDTFLVQLLDQADADNALLAFDEFPKTTHQGATAVPGVGKNALHQVKDLFGFQISDMVELIDKYILTVHHSAASTAPASKEQLTDVAKKAISRLS